MKYFFVLLLVILFLYCVAASNMDKISSSNGDLAIKLYKSLLADFEGENLFFSPLSISTALAMTLLGAQNTTAAQMKEVLGFRDLSDDSIHSGFSELVEKLLLGPEEGCSLKLANRLFGDNSYSFLAEFLEASKKHYGSSLQAVDFKGNPEAARITVNKWVEEKTENKIKDLLSDGSVDPLTVLIIVNAIYFKGSWANQFKPEATQTEPFFVAKDSKRDVEMMHNRAKFGYFEDANLKSKVLDLPYANSSLHMVVVLPNEVDGLGALEDNLAAEVINKWMSMLLEMPSATVTVSLPKFIIRSSFSAKGKLIGLGMADLFSQDKANLNGIASGAEDLFVSDVLHQAFVEVNEEGTEAAAATAVRIKTRSIAVNNHFKADHPFLFFIFDSQTKAILFWGKFVTPSEAVVAGVPTVKQEL